jgi:16S rRNA (adenine1518-N6/adenine1519-N6)-dimethyltransferase
VAYEIDRRLVPLLREVLAGYNVELRSEDVTKVDLAEALGKGPWTMVANLPYNVGTPLILEVLQHAPEVERLVVMVQREVAERLTAAPGDKTYGIPSVVTSLYSDAAIAFSVPPDVFYPAPEVDSSVVEMARKEAPAAADAAIELAAVCFRQRRKMLRRSLEQTFSDPEVVLAAAGLDPTARPEVLSPGDFLRLAEAAL